MRNRFHIIPRRVYAEATQYASQASIFQLAVSTQHSDHPVITTNYIYPAIACLISISETTSRSIGCIGTLPTKKHPPPTRRGASNDRCLTWLHHIEFAEGSRPVLSNHLHSSYKAQKRTRDKTRPRSIKTPFPLFVKVFPNTEHVFGDPPRSRKTKPAPSANATWGLSIGSVQ
jgi:hypothetical protein